MLTVGQRMRRLDDGMEGVVVPRDGELRIVFVDRGETFVAGKREKWTPASIGRAQMREAEIDAVAFTADRMLCAIDRHEPMQWWKAIDPNEAPHDPGLVAVIRKYLSERTG